MKLAIGTMMICSALAGIFVNWYIPGFYFLFWGLFVFSDGYYEWIKELQET